MARKIRPTWVADQASFAIVNKPADAPVHLRIVADSSARAQVTVGIDPGEELDRGFGRGPWGLTAYGQRRSDPGQVTVTRRDSSTRKLLDTVSANRGRRGRFNRVMPTRHQRRYTGPEHRVVTVDLSRIGSAGGDPPRVEIAVPPGSRLTADAARCDFDVNGLEHAKVATREGTITATALGGGSVELSSASGKVTVTESRGSLRVDNYLGDIEVSGWGGGQGTIMNHHGAVHVQNASPDRYLTVTNTAGPVHTTEAARVAEEGRIQVFAPERNISRTVRQPPGSQPAPDRSSSASPRQEQRDQPQPSGARVPERSTYAAPVPVVGSRGSIGSERRGGTGRVDKEMDRARTRNQATEKSKRDGR